MHGAPVLIASLTDADVKTPKHASVTFAIVDGVAVSKAQRDFRYTAKRGKVGRAR